MSKRDKRENIILVHLLSCTLLAVTLTKYAQIASEPLTFEKGAVLKIYIHELADLELQPTGWRLELTIWSWSRLR